MRKFGRRDFFKTVAAAVAGAVAAKTLAGPTDYLPPIGYPRLWSEGELLTGGTIELGPPTGLGGFVVPPDIEQQLVAHFHGETLLLEPEPTAPPRPQVLWYNDYPNGEPCRSWAEFVARHDPALASERVGYDG